MFPFENLHGVVKSNFSNFFKIIVLYMLPIANLMLKPNTALKIF